MAVFLVLFTKTFVFIIASIAPKIYANDILGCGGFVKSHVTLDFSKIEIGLYTKSGSLKEKTECAPTNGYYFLPLYEKGEYVLKVHPPAGWSFEPSQVELSVDGVSDPCSTGQDVNFSFNGFGITGKVITAGQTRGPGGISVQLINDGGDVRNTVTTAGGDFHFTPVIPGKYTLKASHPRWKLEPSQAVVQVKEGNTVLPVGVLAVKGYDVKGSVTSFGSPLAGLYILLYSKEENPKFRVEGCNTALLQGVPDSPICHTVTDASGEFNFGLVPAGEYWLQVLPTPPGQVSVTYNVKPDKVPFTVQHDSLYIKNAFEVTGFTAVGSLVAAVGGPGISGASVFLDGKAVGNTDATGKYTLPYLQPGVYTLTFKHEQCEFEEQQLSVGSSGPRRLEAVAAARWRVCGRLTAPAPRALRLRAERAEQAERIVMPGDDGKWCTFLPPGVYTAQVDVSEQEQREGLQFYPVSQKITVSRGPVEEVVFSQLKGKVSGRVVCERASECEGLRVELRPLTPDGAYAGRPLTTTVKDGAYELSEVLPGSVEVSVAAQRLCWREAAHNVALAHEAAQVPLFLHTGYALTVHASHPIQVEYSGGGSAGVVSAPRGASRQCVPAAGPYDLTPRGCHTFDPPRATVDTSADTPPTVEFRAVAHAVPVRVEAPVAAADLVLRATLDSREGPLQVGPLPARPAPHAGYYYEHTFYLADGEAGVVEAVSEALVSSPLQLRGSGDCLRAPLVLPARRARTLAGRLRPPVAGATVTLHADDLTLTQVTSEDGTYKFGPLDASKQYKITVEKESYVFGEVEDNGDIPAHKLAEITVRLVDDADGTPLQGALVSVSGGTYRHVAAAGGAQGAQGAGDAGDAARFAALQPARYYVKPHAKEYRFDPPHHLLHVNDGEHHALTMRGRRVAWSCVGHVRALGGGGVRGARLYAAPHAHAAHAAHAADKGALCAAEDATTDNNGAFRIRGLLPGCVYTIELKEPTDPELAGLKLVKAPPTLEIKDNKDIENVRLIVIQPHQVTDANVLVYTPNIDHYKTLRLSLALEDTPHTPIYSTKLDAAGFNQNMNPGLMYALPRLPADNKTYIVQLESTLSKLTHVYNEEIHYFNSDGSFKAFNINFLPKVKSSEQELRQSSFLVVPLVILLVLAYQRREELAARVAAAVGGAGGGAAQGRGARGGDARGDLLDRASIDHIVSAVNAAGKRAGKKKTI